MVNNKLFGRAKDVLIFPFFSLLILAVLLGMWSFLILAIFSDRLNCFVRKDFNNLFESFFKSKKNKSQSSRSET